MTFSYCLRYILIYNTKFKRSHINFTSQMRPPCAHIHLLQSPFSLMSRPAILVLISQPNFSFQRRFCIANANRLETASTARQAIRGSLRGGRVRSYAVRLVPIPSLPADEWRRHLMRLLSLFNAGTYEAVLRLCAQSWIIFSTNYKIYTSIQTSDYASILF
jgi:hypothetical protein